MSTSQFPPNNMGDDKHKVRQQRAEQALTAAASDAEPSEPRAQRTERHAPCKCACDLPEPAIGDVEAGCRLCGERLNTDSAGVPYRRWPGDLHSAEMQLRAIARKAEVEMKGLITKLPKREQERLERLAQRHPEQFDMEARRMIDRHLAIKAFDANNERAG